MLGPGDKAPAVRLKTLHGEQWNLHEATTKNPVVLVFFKLACPTCQFTLPFLNRLSGTTAAQIVTVSQDDAEGTREFQEHFQVFLPAVLDEPRTYPASSAFRITHVPSLFVIEQDLTISWALSGFHKAELENLAGRLSMPLFLAGEKVPAMRPG